jgi:precorrin-3B C17-methyltransferase
MIHVVGLGPGEARQTTPWAEQALERCDVLVGYDGYIGLVRGRYPGKELLSTPMRREVERCRMALELAQQGRDVALVCSGDPGVYGMAGLLLELAEGSGIPVEVIPGVTAATAAAAVLGAPLMHDFAVISLSDLMTPWEKIAQRLDAAARADFVICLYNPRSHKRGDHLRTACDIVLRHQRPETVCGWVHNAGRGERSHAILTLAELAAADVDMLTTAIIGNSETKIIDGRIVTPRGYGMEKRP